MILRGARNCIDFLETVKSNFLGISIIVTSESWNFLLPFSFFSPFLDLGKSGQNLTLVYRYIKF